jgi:hypothetical protein
VHFCQRDAGQISSPDEVIGPCCESKGTPEMDEKKKSEVRFSRARIKILCVFLKM